MSDWVGDVTAVATGVAALAAAWAAWKASQTTKASVELVRVERDRWEKDQYKERTAELEATLEIVGTPGVPRPRVTITNLGPAAATDLNATVRAIDGGPAGFVPPPRPALPLALLPRGQKVLFDSSDITDGVQPIVVRAEWTDGNGAHDESWRPVV